jgi:uncharacterized protein with WD repeat
MMFSPDDRFLITYEHYVIYGMPRDADGNVRTPDPNLRFINSSSGKFLTALIQRHRSMWEPRFTADERYFVLVEDSTLRFYDSSGLVVDRVHEFQGKIESFALSSTENPIISVFVCLTDKTGCVSLHSFWNNLETIVEVRTSDVKECTFLWNPKGGQCLVKW